MKVVYDISVLGEDARHQQFKTGVYRIVENVAAALAASGECDLHFCATHSFAHLKRALAYAGGEPGLAGVPFVEPEGRRLRGLATALEERVAELNAVGRVGPAARVARRLMFQAFSHVEKRHHRFDPRAVPRGGVFHSPFYALPDRSKMPVRMERFLTVYDLIPVLAPQFFQNRADHFLHAILRSLRPDDRVICISESTRKELCEYLKLDPERVSVAYPAASPRLFRRVEDRAAVARARAKYGIPDAPYLLGLSTLEPRKNIEHSLRCFARAAAEGGLGDLHFVLVGPRGWDYRRLFDAVAGDPRLRERVIFTGFVEDEDLAPLYSGALAFVYMSFCEGFGLPPLEAMQCGTPVVTSNTSSLPEVVGDAGIMLDPRDADALCETIRRLYHDPSWRAELSAKSLGRARLFSWEKCAREILNAYKAARRN